MSSPNTRLRTEEEELMYDAGLMDGRDKERTRIVGEIERQICFDAQADEDGRCTHHGGKCYELRQLVNALVKGWNQEQEYQAGVRAERDRIIEWIEANRSAIELEPDNNLYRDHFNSQSLLAFIKEENE